MSSASDTIPLAVDKEYEEILVAVLKQRRQQQPPDIHDTEATARNIYSCFADAPIPQLKFDDIVQSKHETKSHDGETISIHRLQVSSTTNGLATKPQKAPAVLHIHGGGMFMGSVAENIPAISAAVMRSGVQFFSVEYRLAPQHPYPTPMEDCYAALVWLLESAETLGIDHHRIALQGESAGGGLAATVALMARDRKLLPKIAKQILIYPMLDDRTISGNADLAKSALLDFYDNSVGWTAMLGDQVGTENVPTYASVARAASVENLPPTYMDVGTLDIFFPEITQFASRLAAVNNVLELHIYPSVPHGFEALVPTSSVYQQAIANRLRALKSI